MKINFLHPATVLVLSFLLVILLGTGLLMLPLASANGAVAPWMTALFTATSAVCVTGLVVVDTGSYWSGTGQVIIMSLFQLDGFGIMTSATLMGLLVSGNMRLRRMWCRPIRPMLKPCASLACTTLPMPWSVLVATWKPVC